MKIGEIKKALKTENVLCTTRSQLRVLRDEFRRCINRGTLFQRIGAFSKTEKAVDILRLGISSIRKAIKEGNFKPEKFNQLRGDRSYYALPQTKFKERPLQVDTS